MPGMRMNDRQMKQAMKKMGIKQSTLSDAVEVVIRTRTSEIIIKDPEVVCVEMGGGKSYQTAGNEIVRSVGEGEVVETEPVFDDGDIEIVMSQAGCDRDKAIAALKEAGGAPAEAIMKLIAG